MFIRIIGTKTIDKTIKNPNRVSKELIQFKTKENIRINKRILREIKIILKTTQHIRVKTEILITKSIITVEINIKTITKRVIKEIKKYIIKLIRIRLTSI